MNSNPSIFENIYSSNGWGDPESKSGSGSNLFQTATIRQEIPTLLKAYGIQSILDIPCGDFYWMKEISTELQENLTTYIGGDIVPALIERNKALFRGNKIDFQVLDLTSSALPKMDLIFTRDCLVHLSYKDILKALYTIKKSGSTYLLTTHFAGDRLNKDIKTGDWRPLNLLRKPFLFPTPLLVINEKCTENEGIYADKSLGLWRVKDLPVLRIRLYLWFKQVYARMNR